LTTTRQREKAEKLNDTQSLDLSLYSTATNVDPVIEWILKHIGQSGINRGNLSIRIPLLRLVILNLYSAYCVSEKRYVAYHRKESRYHELKEYRDAGVTKTLIRVVDDLITLKLIKNHKGVYWHGFRQPYMSRMKATMKLIRRMASYDWTEQVLDRNPNTECIILRDHDTEQNKQIDIHYDDTPATIAIRKALSSYNSLIKQTYIDIPEFPAEGIKRGKRVIGINLQNNFTRRIFNNGTFEEGGRFYGPWWQTIPKEWRQKIRINDEPTIELDYSGLHIILLYAMRGLDYWKMDGQDPYRLEQYGADRNLRSLLKIVLLTIINAKDQQTAVKGVRYHINRNKKDYDWVDEQGFELADLVSEFAERHQPIKEDFFSGKGISLMRMDSDIAADVMTNFVTSSQVCLIIHDSFVVQRQQEELLETFMNQAIDAATKKYLGQSAMSKMKRSLPELEAPPWHLLKIYRRGFDSEGYAALDDYLQEQRKWTRDLENGLYPEYYGRLKRHRERQRGGN
jgi:hypothetical protein